MKVNFIYLSLLLATGLVLTGCGGSSGSSSTPTTLNAAATGVTSAKASIGRAKLFSSDSFLKSNLHLNFLAPNADWTTAHLTNPGGDDCPTMTSAKGYMEGMSNAECTISPFFDLDNLLDMMCVVMNQLNITDGVPDVMAESSITISAATATACGVSDASGATITAEVAATSPQTYFSRLITYSITGTDERTLLMGKSGNKTYLSFAINRPTDSEVYRGIYYANGDTDLTLFEMQGRDKSTGNATVFRIFIDESESPGEVKVVGSRNDNNSTYVRFTYAGPLDGSDDIGAAMSWASQVSGTGVQTCVDPSDNSSDGSTSASCGTDDFTAPTISDWNTTMGSSVTTISGLTENAFFSGLGASDMISFDDSTIATAAIAN